MGYTGKGENAPVRYNFRGSLLFAVNLMTLSSSDTKTPPSYPFRGNVLKFDFELGVKAKALPSGSKKHCKLDRDNTVSTEQNRTIYHFLSQIPNTVVHLKRMLLLHLTGERKAVIYHT